MKAKRKNRLPLGFTLIEVLVVVSIISILAALVVPVLGKMNVSANITRSLSNQRTIAAAALTYANENGTLPGPTWTFISSPEYERLLPEAEQKKNLRRILADYIPERKNVWIGSNPKTAEVSKDMVVLALNNRTTTEPARFFGYPSSRTTTQPKNPIQIASADYQRGTRGYDVTQPSQIWMISDVDNVNYNGLPNGDEFAPINGGRVYVFFDGHGSFVKDADRPANADQRGN